MTLSDTALRSLLWKSRQGRLTADIPDVVYVEDHEEETWVDPGDAWIGELVDQGVAAWRPLRGRPGMPKILYTHEPLNPGTGQHVTAFFQMTEFGLQEHGDALYAAYQAHCPNPESRQVWEDQMRHKVLPAGPAFAGQVRPYTPLPKPVVPPRPKGFDAQGFARSLGPRQAQSLGRIHDDTPQLLAVMEQLRVGPNTQLPGGMGIEGIVRQLFVEGHPQGLAWLDRHGIALTVDAYATAAMYTRGQQTIARWNLLKERGIDPRQPLPEGRSLWSFINWRHGEDLGNIVGWLRQEQIAWTTTPDEATPLDVVLQALNTRHHDDSSDTGSIQVLEQLALDMVAQGVDPFDPNKDGDRPIDRLCVDQYVLDQALIPLRVPFEAFALRFHATYPQLARARVGFRPWMQAFIERLEQATGQTYLNDSFDAVVAQVTADWQAAMPAAGRSKRRP